MTVSDDLNTSHNLLMSYHYRVWFSEEDGEHVCSCEEFPSLSTLSKYGPAHALETHLDLIHTTLVEMQENGEPLPQPLSFGLSFGDFAKQLTKERDAALAELARIRARRFPVQQGPSIPWQLLVPYEGEVRHNHDQTLEQLAQRGGLSPGEVWCAVHATGLRPLFHGEHDDEWYLNWLKAWLQESERR